MICLVLTGRTIEENLEQYRRNRLYVSILELRIDLLLKDELGKVPFFPEKVDLPVILTCRRKSDGGAYIDSERHRFSLMENSAKGNFSYVDLEDDVKRPSFEQELTQRGIKIIRSYHDFKGIPSDLFHRVSRIGAKGEIPKLAVTPNSILDLITLFRMEQELVSVKEKIIVGMGDVGVPSRILYKRLGSMLTFCSENSIAPGQIPARMMKELYHADTVDDRTRIFGVIGNPVLHSSSPQIQNPGFRGINFNAIYVPFLVDSVRSFFILAETLRIQDFPSQFLINRESYLI